jgi:hypothetical protein
MLRFQYLSGAGVERTIGDRQAQVKRRIIGFVSGGGLAIAVPGRLAGSQWARRRATRPSEDRSRYFQRRQSASSPQGRGVGSALSAEKADADELAMEARPETIDLARFAAAGDASLPALGAVNGLACVTALGAAA